MIEWWGFDELQEVRELRDGVPLVAVALNFGSRWVRWDALDDDTLSMRELDVAADEFSDGSWIVATGREPWTRFVGKYVRWGRAMTNHHGWLDGYQLEFTTGEGAIGDGVEMIVAASSVQLGTSRFSRRS